MIARLCYQCGAGWEAPDGNTDILCPACRGRDERAEELRAELIGIADTLRKIVAALQEIMRGIDEEVGT